MQIVDIIGKVNGQLGGCRIIAAGPGWGKTRWLVEDKDSGQCKPISQSDILAIASERNLISAAARALGARGGARASEAQKAAARRNGRLGGRPRKQQQ